MYSGRMFLTGIWGTGICGIKKKPSPEGVEALLEELGISKEECLYLGDTNTDMETGQAAQVDTVGVTWGFGREKSWRHLHQSLWQILPSR